jgi:hypothetical protein
MGVQPPIMDEGPVARAREHVFSLGSAPIYVPATFQPEPEAVAPEAVVPDAVAPPVASQIPTPTELPS